MRLLSRNRTIFNDDYPQLIDALKILTAKNVIFDAEIAAMIERRGVGVDHFVRQVIIGKTGLKGPDNGVEVRLR